MSVEIISVHFPKSGGSSFGQTLLAAYGKDAVYLDYADDPVDPCSQYSMDPEGCRRKAQEVGFVSSIKVIHGHFHLSKYEFLKGCKIITFLRHPVDNLISIYYFWKAFQGSGHSLFKYFRDNQLSLTDLAQLPSIRYLLSRTYFGDVDMNSFDFIGFQENFAEDLHALSKLLSVPLVESKENANSFQSYTEEVNAIKADRRLMTNLHNCLLEDIKFYENIKIVRRTG
jgi:Sulfotransferase family